MADQYDVTEGQCPEDCPDVEVVTYCINELQQVQNISRVNVKKCCPEDCPCDGEYNSEGCTLCGKCDGHPGFDLPKTFCVADTQPAQNVMRVNVNKDADSLWEIGVGNILQPKDGKTFTIKKAHEVNAETGSADKYLNEQGNFTKPITSHKDVADKNAETAFQHATQAQHDRWTNNYSYKIEDTSVTTWVASTAYAGYGFQARINIANLSEFDSVNVVFGLLDAISGNYAPAIEIYSGYILVFAKVNTAITIPTIEITKIDL